MLHEIPLHLDNTMISSYRTCPRKFYYRHIRSWRGIGTAPALAFGSAWHEAMDVVWKLSQKDQGIEQIHAYAMAKWSQKWEEEGFSTMLNMAEQDQLSPRTPGNASEMVWNYIEKRTPFLKTIDLVFCEKPFMVTFTDPGLPKYIGRIDKGFRDESGNFKLGEHKTTSLYAVKGGIQPRYIESFSPNSQIDGYFFASQRELNLNATACFADLALVHKQHHNIFKMVPLTRNQPAINNWETETTSWIDMMLADYSALLRLEEDEPMHCFPRNTDSCFDFFTQCTYIDLCRYKDKPQAIHDLPPGLVVEKWEPFKVLGFEQDRDEK